MANTTGKYMYQSSEFYAFSPPHFGNVRVITLSEVTMIIFEFS